MEKTNFKRRAKNSLKIKNTVNKWISEKGYLTQGITIEILGRKLGINRTYISNYINDIYNTNFNCWINAMRVDEAKQILKEKKEISIGEIAFMVGYADITHFSKQFKHYTGINPSIWKKMMHSKTLA